MPRRKRDDTENTNDPPKTKRRIGTRANPIIDTERNLDPSNTSQTLNNTTESQNNLPTNKLVQSNHNIHPIPLPENNISNRMKAMADVAKKRALHFARGDNDETNQHLKIPSLVPVTSTPFPAQIRKTSKQVNSENTELDTLSENKHMSNTNDDSNNEEHWPGPWTTARELVKKRSQFALEREKKILLSQPNDKKLEFSWIPKNNGNRIIQNEVKSLSSICLETITKYYDQLPVIEGMNDIQKAIIDILCKKKLLTGSVLEKLIDYDTKELIIPDCSSMDQSSLTKILEKIIAVENCYNRGFTSLQLNWCGRAFGASVVDTIIKKGFSLEILVANGSYTLTEKKLKELLEYCKDLKHFEMQSSLISKETIENIAQLEKLEKLVLDNCFQLSCEDILPLAKMKNLQHLSLAGVTDLDDETLQTIITPIGNRLKYLSIERCQKITDASIHFIKDKCHNLTSILLGECVEISFQVLLEFFISPSTKGQSAPKKLSQVSLRKLSDLPENIPIGIVEMSFQKLRQLDLHSLVNITDRFLVCLAENCSETLEELDLSFCRSFSDNGLGYMVDSCTNLKRLSIWGCTQITKNFLDYHSNFNLKIVGR